MSLLANLIAKKKFILQLVSRAVLVGFLVMLGLTIYVYTFKNQIVQKLLTNTNKGYRGRVACGDVGVSLFRGFPYVSLTVNDLKVYENKKDTAPILSVEKSYFGFELLSLLQENYQIRKITFERGYAHIIQYNADEYNITRAFEPVETQAKDTAKSTLYLNIDALKLYDITIDKQNLETNIRIETEIKQLESKFSKSKEDIFLWVDSKFTLNAYKNQKPTYIYHKHFDAETKLTYHKASQIIDIDKALVKLEGSEFNMTGNIDTKGDMPVDLVFEAQKSDFNLVIAMAPEALIPTLSSYKNKANIKFLATIKGPTANNQQPQVNIDLKCQDAQIINPDINKKIDQIGFSLNFTNGKERNNKTSVLQLKDFFARPNIGKFKANLTVKNLDAPEIDMQLDTDFDLEFLSKFFRINQLSNLSGKVMLQMNFHDIIDIQNPQTSLDRFNQAYYAKLEVNNLNFKVNTYALPISNINIAAEMDAKKLLLKNLSLNVANSNIAINGFATNLPAIIHKTKDEIHSELYVKSNLIDLNQLTQNKIDEAIEDFKMDVTFKGKANTYITSHSLPVGQYYFTNISGKPKYYHHALKKFNGIFYIDSQDIAIKRLDGQIDQSDMHIEGKVKHYDFWLREQKRGDTKIYLDLSSKALHLADIFSYKGKNYIPKEYQSEDIQNLRFKASAALHYRDTLHSLDFVLDQLEGKMKYHPQAFKGFQGQIHLENNALIFHSLKGNLGENDLNVSGKYYLSGQGTHKLQLTSNRLDINELTGFKPKEDSSSTQPIDHDSGFNLFKEPFPNAQLALNVKSLIYGKYLLTNLSGNMRIQQNHMVYLDKLKFNTAEGIIQMSGYFNGSNPNKIYLSPDIKMQGVNLEKLMLKFDNFGQDNLVSDNIKGIMTGRVSGKVLLHTDLTPNLKETDLTIDAQLLDVRLRNYAPMQAMAQYFGDKNLANIRFDTIENRMRFQNGTMSFPNMTLNSSLGYIQLSGSQGLDLTMDYFIRVPLKLVKSAVFSKLFGRKPKDINPEQEDEIIVKDPNRKTRFINIRLTGTPEDYKISLRKNPELKKGVEFQKDENFLFPPIENEVVE